jgi:diguanylate cyclase (GGDEF)-like protein/PAS domain S-box-containing protein
VTRQWDLDEATIRSEAAQHAPEKTSPILHGNHLPMWIHDRKTLRFLEVSEGAVRQYGYSREEFLSMTIRDITPIHELVKLDNLDPHEMEPDDIDPGRLRMHMRKDGTVFPVRVYSNALMYNGRIARLVVAKNVTQQLGLYTASSNGQHYEWNLGLPTLQELQYRAQEAMDNADRKRRRIAVVCLDLDNLDDVSERLGPEANDACLRQVGRLLTRRVRGMDTVGRTGQRAFTIVLAELGDDFDLYRVAQALLKIFAEPVHFQDSAIVLTASIGVAAYPDDGYDFTRLCHAADTAMQQARAGGGDRIAMYSLEASERTELDTYMREVLRHGGFRLHYQPQYTAAGEAGTLEALLRLPGREGGFISPDLFIPIAEQTGIIEQLGLWVIGEASRQAALWKREYGIASRIAINVSPLQLRVEDFAAKALALIRSHGIAPATIEFEITERSGLDLDAVIEPMRELANAGIVFAVDDFGTGYSSLQHLHRLPISVLKIDRSFVQRMGDPQGAGAIVGAIVSMAHTMGMEVIAEGVETQAQRDAATGMGCDSIQGFLHSAAVEANRVPKLMGWFKDL